MAASTADSTAAEFAHLARTDSLILASLDRMRGVVQGADTMVAWKVFEAHPRRTVVLLMPTLRSIPHGLSLGAPNMVWRVRVLQRLTGLTFRARTRARLGEEEKKWLAPDSTGAVPFAGENAARGMTWVAPRDAQRDILDQWRRWWDGISLSTPLPVKDRSRDGATWWY
ncbi:MAG: hypothetical protein HZA61_06100 [Candidatus Eisenbacteria bacterium]|uniref:Uncharacterized protein n=1 Tax=Eiseniibacteriota bacterium TaxID=2212470 RepID=A0A933SB30_UNCEI|nr:hypothetical protein [Candidatus Eisenbacteria bacterium]